jgi:MYXO-CTERM domain-containing protein
LTYQGHGKETYWWPGVLTTDDLPALANSGQSGALVAGTCDNGHFFDVSVVSLAEGLLATSNGGSWAVWSSTGQSSSQVHGPLSAALLQAAVIDGFTLGEATLRAKAAISDPDVRAIFHLFGDPTARLAPATDKALSTPSTAQQKATGCTVPGDTELAVLPLVAIALLLARARRRTADVRIRR